MLPVRKNNTIQLFERLLLLVHAKLISRLIGQRYLMGFKEIRNFRNLFFSLIEDLTAKSAFLPFISKKKNKQINKQT